MIRAQFGQLFLSRLDWFLSQIIHFHKRKSRRKRARRKQPSYPLPWPVIISTCAARNPKKTAHQLTASRDRSSNVLSPPPTPSAGPIANWNFGNPPRHADTQLFAFTLPLRLRCNPYTLLLYPCGMVFGYIMPVYSPSIRF